MRALFKKHFWVVSLAGLALLALAAGGFVNDWFGSKLFVVPARPSFGAPPGVPDDVDAGSGRVANDDASRVLASRLIFDLDPPRPDAVIVQIPEPVAQPAPPASNGPPEESQLPIDLVGTLAAEDATASVASFRVEGQSEIGWVGTEFLDGRAKVTRIGAGHVVLQEGDRVTMLRIWDERGKGSHAAPAMPRRPDPLPRDVGGVQPVVAPDRAVPAAPSARDGIEKVGEGAFKVSRAMIDRELRDLGKLQSGARVVPNYKDGRYQGFKVVGVRPESLFRGLGIQSGDVITSVNGNAIDSPNKALVLFEQLKSSSDIKVSVERRGKPTTLSYQIQ